jgi:hypothetical protein
MTILIALVAIAVTAAGLLVYVLAANPKIGEIGRIVFAVGLVFTVLILAVSFHVKLL